MKSNKKQLRLCAVAAITGALLPGSVFAADSGTDPLTAISNLKEWFISIITAVGVLACVWGIVQVAMAFKSQDGTMKTQGFLFLAGGLVIAGVHVLLGVLGVA